MKGFNTLTGLLQADEQDGHEPRFAHHATLRIFSAERLDFEAITVEMGLTPTTTHRLGERAGPRSPPFQHDAWMYRAPVAEARDLPEHIDTLWNALKPHTSYLRSLKSHAKVDVFLGYASNIDHAGVQIPYLSLEMFVVLEIEFALSIVVVTDD